jgi:hypothetical protein
MQPAGVLYRSDSSFLFTQWDLQHAMVKAYQQAAVKLMYSTQDNIYRAWTQPNLTAAVPWTILVPSSPGVPPLLILVCLVLWGPGRMLLVLIYGFRKRWEASFRVGSLYWYCKEIVEVDPLGVIRDIRC